MTRTTPRRLVVRGVRITILALAVWLVVSWAVAYRLTRRPHPRFEEPTPVANWGGFKPFRLKTRDGHNLGAWLVPGKAEAPSVVLLHGNGGSRANCLGLAEFLAADGCTVLLVSLRAHGDSTGEFNDIGYSARHDIVAAVDFLERRRPGKPIVIHGISLGSAAALFASKELADRVHGYILECPYRDLKSAVWNRVENALPPILDRIAYHGLLTVAPLVLPDLEKISPIDAVLGVPDDVPILILSGGQDRRARPDDVRTIHDRVRSHARLSVFEKAGHIKFLATEPERHHRRGGEYGFVRGVGRGRGLKARPVGWNTTQ